MPDILAQNNNFPKLEKLKEILMTQLMRDFIAIGNINWEK